jgi:plastocyanin
MNKTFLALGFLPFLLLGAELRAETYFSIQAGKTFLPKSVEAQIPELVKDPALLKKASIQEMKIKTGDAIVFENHDTVAHNLYANFFDLKVQDVGQKSVPIVFKDAGEFKVNCAIHPKMSLKVIVEK